jgi:hypothetical protein
VEGIFYNTDNKSINLLRFYQDMEVISATFTYSSEPLNDLIIAFDKDHYITKLDPNIYSKTKYKINDGKLVFTFNNDGHIVTYNAKPHSNIELIIEIENHKTGYRTISRYSNINKFPERNDNIEFTQDFYPILLLPNNIIQNIKSDVSIEKVYEFLNIKIPKLENLELPTKPLNYKYVEKEKLKFQGDGFSTIAQLIMSIFFAIIFVMGLLRGESISFLFLFCSIVMGYFSFSVKKISISEKIEIPNDIYLKLLKEYEKDKNLIKEKNIALKEEFHKKMKLIDNEIGSKIAEIKHNVFLSNLKPINKAVRSGVEGQRGKTELYFLNRLHSKFGNQIKVDMVLITDYQQYFPDFTFVCERTGLHIDIEIDEPYSFLEKKPIHHTGTNDDERNRCFLEQNWCVLRFSEKQIVKDAEGCIFFIEKIINSILDKSLDFPTNIIASDKRWTLEESLVMMYNNIRNNY